MAGFMRYTMTFVGKSGGRQVPCSRCKRCKKVRTYKGTGITKVLSAAEYLSIWEEEHLKWCGK